ncbi:hypothetical protein BO99DRAFT_476386 [Aspergillus violaceofuscus CBS 115571]|uniref:Rhodopsin domain-containing protein n=1 Tax=Aspergillus violaceofuscus (strain CBS 115571) TaxID=1450538 RepID=A0A2V5H379_ASPV1|nr:hypothetical protein BO99DRAFT_476386 [Aspergillus violaceofuscus CBS 115571]
MMSHSMFSVGLSQTRQPNSYASSTISFCMAFLCVGLRFWCCWKNTAGLWLDDWLILVSLTCGASLTASLLRCKAGPFGITRLLETRSWKSLQTVRRDATQRADIGLFSCGLPNTGIIVLVKCFILALYWRLLNRTNIKIPVSILATAICMWGIAVVSVIFPPSSRRSSLTIPVSAHGTAMLPNPRSMGSWTHRVGKLPFHYQPSRIKPLFMTRKASP